MDKNSLLTDIHASAKQVATELSRSGYRADFSAASLWDLEAFFIEHTRDGAARPKRLLATQTGARLFALGSYLGETLRAALGGEWMTNDADEDGEINVALRLPNGTICWPVQRVMKRFAQGANESLVVYALSLGVPMTQPPFTTKLRRIGRRVAYGW